MPIIPRVDPQVKMQASAPVAIAGTSDARISGESLQAAGKGLMSFGEQQIDFGRKIASEEFANTSANIAKRAMDTAKQQAKPDGSDLEQIYHAEADSQLQSAVTESAGWDPKLKTSLGGHLGMLQDDVKTSLQIQKNSMLESHNYNRLGNVLTTNGDSVRENPNESLLDAKMRSFNATVDAAPISGENKEKLKSANYSHMATSFIDGLANKQMYGKALQYLRANQEDAGNITKLDPKQAQELGFLDGEQAKQMMSEGKQFELPTLTKGDKVRLTPAMAQALSHMQPSEKAHLIDQMRNANNERTQVRVADINAQKNGIVQSMLAGVANIGDKDVGAVKAQINQVPNMTVQARARAMDEIDSTYVVYKSIQLAATASPDQIVDIKNKLQAKMALKSGDNAAIDPKLGNNGKDFAIISNRAELAHKFDQSFATMQEKRKQDPAGMGLASDPQLQLAYAGTKDGKGFDAYAQMALSKQSYVGVAPGDRKLLPKGEASTLAQTITSASDPDTAAGLLNDLQRKYGKHLPQVLNEATQIDKRVGDLRVLAFVPSENRAGLFDAVKNADAIKTRIESDVTLKEYAKKGDLQINTKLKDFALALTGTSANSMGQATVASMQNLMQAKMRRDLLQDSTASVSDLTDRAYKEVVTDNFNIITSGKSSVIIPKRIDDQFVASPQQTKIFKSFMDTYSSGENLKDLGVFVPTGQKENEAGYLNQLAKNSRWVTNETQTGMMLVQATANGGSQAVKDKYNKRVEKSFHDIYMTTDKKVVDGAKGIVSRMFGG